MLFPCVLRCVFPPCIEYGRTWGILRGMEEGTLLGALAGGICLVSLCNMAFKINTCTIKTQIFLPDQPKFLNHKYM